MKIETRQATKADIDTLAEWNKQLIEDEGSTNPMTVEQLAERMTGFLNGDYRAVIVTADGADTGYILYKQEKNEYFPDRKSVYVRQYFIDRTKRSKGIGETAFNIIADKHLKGAELNLDVLEDNPKGRRFWEKIGFKPNYTAMKRKPQQP
jgi:GNAT superfamily N-acetyltransferase